MRLGHLIGFRLTPFKHLHRSEEGRIVANALQPTAVMRHQIQAVQVPNTLIVGECLFGDPTFFGDQQILPYLT